jgi:hypothetical protein
VKTRRRCVDRGPDDRGAMKWSGSHRSLAQFLGPTDCSDEVLERKAPPCRSGLRAAWSGSLRTLLDSSPETSTFRALRAVRILAEAPRLLMSSRISASGTVNQRPFGARGLSMRGETIHGQAREGRPGARRRHRAGPPRETSTHATPCRKTPYARRKTRTPRPCGQGVRSEPAGAPVSRSLISFGGLRPLMES